MNYQEFVAIICKEINNILNPKVKASLYTALKNNHTKRTGITISELSTNISPTIYLEEYYEQYLIGRSIDDIVCCIVSLYYEVRFEHSWDVTQIQDYNLAQSNIMFKLINFEKNLSLLKDIPHIKYLDLAIVFYILLDKTERGAATILITNEMIKHWSISLAHLYRSALRNTPLTLIPEFKTMRAVIRELLDSPSAEDIHEDNYMYVLTNQHRHFGAACILYNDVLNDIGRQLNENYYILPSSIHEVIILPASCHLSQEQINEMIVEINTSQVSEEEILSDHAYYYDRCENNLKY